MMSDAIRYSDLTDDALDEALSKIFKNEFMKPDIECENWFSYEDTDGGDSVIQSEFFDSDLLRLDNNGTASNIMYYRQWWGARLAAPGYVDSTEWTIHRTERAAKVYLLETYADEVSEKNDACEECGRGSGEVHTADCTVALADDYADGNVKPSDDSYNDAREAYEARNA